MDSEGEAVVVQTSHAQDFLHEGFHHTLHHNDLFLHDIPHDLEDTVLDSVVKTPLPHKPFCTRSLTACIKQASLSGIQNPTFCLQLSATGIN